jgi:hypothetical protein
VFLFDLLVLGSATTPQLITASISFFQLIFSSQFIKLGWDFNKNDAKKLMSSGSRDINGQGRLSSHSSLSCVLCCVVV